MKRNIRFQLDGVTYQVEVERKGDQLTVCREGERYMVSLLEAGPAPAPCPPEGAKPEEAGAQAREPLKPGAVKPGPAGATPGGAAKAGPAGAKPDPGLLCAPMTGLIKEVKVAAGSCVARGEVVLVMEAMKMDVEVSAPASGIVAEVNVSAGQNVESQAPLLLIRP